MADDNGRKPVGNAFRIASRRATTGCYGRPGVEPYGDSKRVEAEKSARELVDRLKSTLDTHACNTVALAAPPEFLGIVTALIGNDLQFYIEPFVSEHLTHFADGQAREHIVRLPYDDRRSRPEARVTTSSFARQAWVGNTGGALDLAV